MKCVFFTNTPAHVHLYKHAVRKLRDRGHETLVLARDYTCTVDLLEWYDLSYEVYGYCGTTKTSLMSRLPAHYLRAIRTIHEFDPDLIFGMGCYAAHAGAVSRTPTVLLIDSEPSSFDHAISTPFARTILTPNTFRKDLGEDHYVFPGVKECAYLHPESYAPNQSIREQLGLESDESYVIVRLNAFGSQHDVGKEGITGDQRYQLIERLSEDATVFVSDEGNELAFDDLPARPFDLHPALLHDALAEADLLVADTQTMVTEAALLGTPAIRSNSFVGNGDMGNFVELEKRGLIYNVREFDELETRARSLLGSDGVEAEWRRRRDEFFAETTDLTDVIVAVATNRGLVDGVDALRPFDGSAESDDESMSKPPKHVRVEGT